MHPSDIMELQLNQPSSEWTLERLQMGITNVVSLKSHLLSYLDTHSVNNRPADDEELGIVRRYSTLLEDFVIML